MDDVETCFSMFCSTWARLLKLFASLFKAKGRLLTLFRLGFFGQSVTGGKGGGAPRTPPLYLWNQ